MSLCRSCSAPIDWALTAKGNRMPLDPGLNAHGNVLVDEAGVARVVPAGQGDRVAHFVTCPNANAHRKRARRG